MTYLTPWFYVIIDSHHLNFFHTYLLNQLRHIQAPCEIHSPANDFIENVVRCYRQEDIHHIVNPQQNNTRLSYNYLAQLLDTRELNVIIFQKSS